MAILLPAILALVVHGAAGDGDLELASELARRGWVDLADELCDRVEKSPSASAAANANVALVRAEIAFVRARMDRDLANALRTMESAEKGLRATGSLECRSTLGWLMAQRGRLAWEASQAEQDRDRESTLKAEAAKAYAAVEEHFRSFILDLTNLPRTEAVEQALLDARLELPRAMIGRARTGTIDAPSRRKVLEEAVRLLLDFQLDASPRPISVEAEIEEARGHLELGDGAKAESRSKSALAQLKSARPTTDGRDLAGRATGTLARAVTIQRKGKDGVLLIDRFLKDSGAALALGAQLTLRLEKAEALAASDDTATALAEFQAVQKADPDGLIGGRAARRVRELLEGPLATPERLLTVAEGLQSRGQFRDALVFFRRCVEACKDAADLAKFEPVAAFKRGESLQALRRHLEAVEAYKDVYVKYPKHDLASQAGFESVVCLNQELSLSSDPGIEKQMEKLLDVVAGLGLQGPREGFVKYLRAVILERKGSLPAAAELYRQVDEGSPIHGRALVAAGHCWFRDAISRWEKGRRDPGLRAEIVKELARAEESLTAAIRSLERAEGGDASARVRILSVAYQEAAAVLLHDLVRKIPEAISILDRWEKLAGGDGAPARLWELKVQAQLKNDDSDAAATVLEKMLAKFPDGEATARASNAVAIRLDQRAAEMIEKKEDEKTVVETLRKSARFTKRWMDLAPGAGLKLGVPEIADGADRLYRAARRANGLDAGVGSFLDLNGRRIPDAPMLLNAVAALTLLESRRSEMTEKDAVTVRMRLARCLGFQAIDARGWGATQAQYDALIRDYKLLGADGQLDRDVARAQPWILSVYLEEGGVCLELARLGQKFQFDNALAVQANLLKLLPHGVESWWKAKLATATILFERGAPKDLEMVRLLLANLELNDPELDAGKFGMKEKFAELRAKVRAVSGR